MPTIVTTLTGKAAAKASAELDRQFADLRAELDRRGAKTYEAVVLLDGDQLTSAVDDGSED